MKEDGSLRITVDYTKLNEVIEFDPYPMPAAHLLYSELAEGKWFSKFDFYKAYHQIPTEESSIKYTAFICEWGLYEYPSMPMGIKTAAAWFQRCMDISFAQLIQRNSLKCFLDDIVLYTHDDIRRTPQRNTYPHRDYEKRDPQGISKKMRACKRPDHVFG